MLRHQDVYPGDEDVEDIHEKALGTETRNTAEVHASHSPTSAGLSSLGAAALLVADIVGTGVLALPSHVHTLGLSFGMTFLVLQVRFRLSSLYRGVALGRRTLFCRCMTAEKRVWFDGGQQALRFLRIENLSPSAMTRLIVRGPPNIAVISSACAYASVGQARASHTAHSPSAPSTSHRAALLELPFFYIYAPRLPPSRPRAFD
eukprot:6142146-Pleurochrysis_carterae.AAC.4